MIKLSGNKELDIKFIKWMMQNEEVSPQVLRFLVGYLIETIKNDKGI
jgi:hypothetical protein